MSPQSPVDPVSCGSPVEDKPAHVTSRPREMILRSVHATTHNSEGLTGALVHAEKSFLSNGSGEGEGCSGSAALVTVQETVQSKEDEVPGEDVEFEGPEAEEEEIEHTEQREKRRHGAGKGKGKDAHGLQINEQEKHEIYGAVIEYRNED